MAAPPEPDDDALLAGFLDRSFPYSAWTHKAHLRVAYILLTRFGFADGLARIRSGIQAYNLAWRVPEGPQTGYHETVTAAWARILDSQIRHQGPGKDSRDFVESQPQLWSRSLLRLFYSRERFLDPRAKTEFVEPDLTALPS